MTRDASSLVPSFSIEVEPSPAVAEDAARRLDAFAAEHEVKAGVRERLAAVTVEVLTSLAGADQGSGAVLLEADIDQGDLQIVFTRKMASRGSVDEMRARLAGVGESSDGFSAERADGTTLQVWLRFSLA